MFDEIFNVFIWSGKDIKNIDDVIMQDVWRVIGESGIEEFNREMFNYACDGYNVEFSIMK